MSSAGSLSCGDIPEDSGSGYVPLLGSLSFPSTLTSLTVPAAEQLLVPSRHEEELVSSSRTYVGFFL